MLYSQTSRDMAKANNLAVAAMEELMSVYGSDPKLIDGAHTQNYDREGNPVPTNGYFQVEWRVARDTPIPRVAEIRLFVFWAEGTNRRIIRLHTFRGI